MKEFKVLDKENKVFILDDVEGVSYYVGEYLVGYSREKDTSTWKYCIKINSLFQNF